MDIDLTKYESHPNKLLTVHTQGVTNGAQRRTNIKLAEVAAIFHDLGKINPNFQRKLYGKVIGYTSHSYLSALAWLCFCQKNRKLVGEWFADDQNLIVAITAIIAHHHGNLPDLATQTTRIFKTGENDPTAKLKKFLVGIDEKDLPLSGFLQQLQAHETFTIFHSEAVMNSLCGVNLYGRHIPDPLELYMNTQFGFASLIEADKRDAGYNETYNKELRGESLSEDFSIRLNEKLNSFTNTEAEGKSNSLNKLRTEMREQAVESLQRELIENLRRESGAENRVFSLSAPTGAGKTLMLLQLAAEILKHDSQKEKQLPLGIIYALPFLSITEQTESICKGIFYDQDNAVMRVDSKARNKQIEDLQQQLEANPDDEKLSELMSEIFSEDTFDHPFIVTTFVQVFETLISNRNATLLRLPNFARAIFLIDEIQALPPRLYTFFTAYLEEFCRKFDSYAIASTATMPSLDIKGKGSTDTDPTRLFRRYRKPCELLDDKHFTADVFNRYRIKRLSDEVASIDELAEKVGKQTKSCLVVLNTINDTRELYDKLIEKYADEPCCYVLLNTRFTPRDRQRKLKFCKRILKRQRSNANYKRRVVLISTQLIEAGVDIDFPVLYRDMCPLPNLIQSAGRCNRNGEDERGEVFLFELKREHGKKSSSEMIYGRSLEWFLTFTKNEVTDNVTENEMFSVQRKFFDKVNDDLTVGLHEPENATSINMVKCINELAFEQLGRFRLIDEDANRIEVRYFIPRSSKVFREIDLNAFRKLEDRIVELKQVYKTRNFERIKHHKSRVEDQMRKLSAQIVNVKVAPHDLKSLPDGEEAAGIRLLADGEDYSSSTGFVLNRTGGRIL